MAAFEAGLANRTPVSKPGFLRLHWALHPISLYSGRPHSSMLVVPALLLTGAQSHRLRERKVFSQDGLHTIFLPSSSSSAGQEVPADPCCFSSPVVYLTSRNLTQPRGREPHHLFTHGPVPRCGIIPLERIASLWLRAPPFLHFLYSWKWYRCPLNAIFSHTHMLT